MGAFYRFWAICTLLASGFAGAEAKPKVDRAAMQEAIGADASTGWASSAAYAHFLRSRMAALDGDLKTSLNQLRLALANDPGNAFLMLALAEHYGSQKQWEKAERALKDNLKLHPDFEPAHLLIGKVLLERHTHASARWYLRRAVELRPADLEARLALAQVYLEIEKPDDAVHIIETFPASAPGEWEGQKRLGLVFIERKDFTRANKLLNEVAQAGAADVDVWLGLARINEMGQLYPQAERFYSRALELDPDHLEGLLSAGQLALKLNKKSAADAYFNRLLSVDEGSKWVAQVAFAYLGSHHAAEAATVLDAARRESRQPALSFYAGLVHEKLGQLSEAVRAYSEVDSSSENGVEAGLRKANVFSFLGRHALAIAAIKEVLKRPPELASTRIAYARILERSGDLEGAITSLSSTLTRNASVELYDGLAALYQRHGRGVEAQRMVEKALVERPHDETLLYILGAVYERQGSIDKALAQMRAVLVVNPDHAAAMNFMGYLLAERGTDYLQAEHLLVRALQIQPDTGSFMDSLGWIYYRKGDYLLAMQTLEKAVNLSPDEPQIIEHLGDAYLRNAKDQMAVRAYRRALDALKAPAGEISTELRDNLERKIKMVSSKRAGR